MPTETKNGYAPRMKTAYHEAVVPGLMEKFAFKNPYQVPRLKKIVVNMGVSEARENIKAIDQAAEDLSVIAGQKAEVRRAKKSISNFKLREGMPIGLRVTLRGARMYEFFDRLVSIAIPRMRDFRGLDLRGFDGRGNFNLGLNEQYVFPEINADKSDKPRGMNITFVTSAGRDDVAREFLIMMGMPFKKAEAKPEARETKKA
ncbi:MAG: 50S ribosomal protein L5 [Elusimicrobiota bacterium]|jgi:large subunit ribosomal protein L5